MRGSLDRGKVVIIGDSGAGKTSILYRQTGRSNNPAPTINANPETVRVRCGDEMVQLRVWDTAGQEIYKALVPLYARRAEIAVIVYSVTDPQSLTHVDDWVTFLRQAEPAIRHHFLVANKIDLEESDPHPHLDEAAWKKADQFGLRFHRTSAVNGVGVSGLFEEIAKMVLQSQLSEARTEVQPLEPNADSTCPC
jgi:small GTP-binding protein